MAKYKKKVVKINKPIVPFINGYETMNKLRKRKYLEIGV